MMNYYLCLMHLIEKNINKLTLLCRQHKVKELYIFGSILTKGFNDLSDIDFLVQFDDIDINDYFDNYMDFKEKLEDLFGRQIDLLENQAIRNPIFRKVLDRNKRLVYDRETA
jgi:predicted nucleotidyltransferase